MNPAPQFDRVHSAIRARLLSGEWPPGKRIDLAVLADELGASITPVRDVLYRLVGERLLTAGVHDGFAVPAITEPELRDLYAWNRDLLQLALGNVQRDERGFDNSTGGDLVERTGRLFHMIGARSQNPEHAVTIDAVNARLHSARLAEGRLGIADEVEFQALIKPAKGHGALVMQARLDRYHSRREAAAGRIVYALYRPDSPA